MAKTSTTRKTSRKAAARKTTPGRRKTNTAQSKRSTAGAKARKITQSGENVRQRVRDLTIGLARDGWHGINVLSTVASDVMHGAIEGAKDLVPKDRESTLRQVVDGLGEAYSRTARAAHRAMKEAATKGHAFKDHEVRRTAKDLSNLQAQFVEVTTRATKRAGHEISGEVEALTAHIHRTARRVRPPVERALRAVWDHPGQFAGETASATARAVPRATSAIMHAIGGLLHEAGDAVARLERGSSRTSRSKKKTKRSR